MGAYLADRSRRTLHRLDDLQPGCLRGGFDVRDLEDLHDARMVDWLVRGERWAACPHCLYDGEAPPRAR